MRRRKPSTFTVLGWLLALVMALYFALIIAPEASADEPKPKLELVLEVKEERLRILRYEDRRVLCHLTIMKVSMIGAQHSWTCLWKQKNAHSRAEDPPFQVPLR